MAGGDAVVDVDVVDDDVGDVLESYASAAGDVDVGAAAVDGFEAVDEEFFGEADGHVGGEGDPERDVLDDAVPESARWGVDRVGVGGVSDDIELAGFATESGAPKADATVGKALPFGAPVRARAAPAIVDGVAGEAGVEERAPVGVVHLPA